METFDLTTKDGMEIAKKYVLSYFGLTPVEMLYKLGKIIFDSDRVKKQGKTVEDLIKVGKEKGVDEMEITLDNKNGFHFDAPIDEGIKIDTVLGSDEKVRIRVKYK